MEALIEIDAFAASPSGRAYMECATIFNLSEHGFQDRVASVELPEIDEVRDGGASP